MELKIIKPRVGGFCITGGVDAWKEVVYSARMSGVPPEVRDEDVFRMIVSNDYRSALEHVIVKFDVKMSKGNAPEFLEHRAGISHSGYSTRYIEVSGGVDKEEPAYEVIAPFHLLTREMKDAGMDKSILDGLESSVGKYVELLSKGAPREIARYVLPFAQAVGVYHVSMNLRSLLHMLSLRLCVRSSPEFRCIAAQLYLDLVEAMPLLKGLVGCRGFMNGTCPESGVTGVRSGPQHPFYPPCIYRGPDSEIYIPTTRELRKGASVKGFNKARAVEAQENLYRKWADWS
ncbi:MAG: FAD-dependent thymidylate synthase [Candidatus Altiarchaeota archaeon]|nr:FAD-dependent thymidylate synthase [Candidatus Altiarchaeota archaeon]